MTRLSPDRRGFTLIELMVVVAIVGILAVLATFGVNKYITNAKTAEARNSLGQIGKDAVTTYSQDSMSGGVLPVGAAAALSRTLCTSATAKVPASKASIAGKKYQSNPAAGKDWQLDQGTQGKGFTCLRFAITDAQYFMYNFTSVVSTGPNIGSTNATAEGDLNGDGVLSTFTLLGKVQGGELTMAPNISELSPDE